MPELITEKSVVLSICIPTYNRPNELRRLLRSIALQYVQGVQVLVGDDGDSLVTKRILHEFSGMHITHIENTSRKGFSGNLLSVSEYASGEYVWWVGDDDELEDGALSCILEIIAKDTPGILWANVRSSSKKKPYGRRKNSGYVRTSNEALEQVGPLLAFISSIIFRKNTFLQIDTSEIDSHRDSIFINFFLALHIILANGPLYYVARPCIIVHWTAPGDSWHDTFQTYGVDFLGIINYFKKEFSLRAYRSIVGEMFSFCWKALLVERARTDYSLYPIIIPMIQRYWSYPDIVIAVPLFLLPRFVIKILYRVYCAVASPGVAS